MTTASEWEAVARESFVQELARARCSYVHAEHWSAGTINAPCAACWSWGKYAADQSADGVAPAQPIDADAAVRFYLDTLERTDQPASVRVVIRQMRSELDAAPAQSVPALDVHELPWTYESENHADHSGADTFHHVVAGERHIGEIETEADARLIVRAVNAYLFHPASSGPDASRVVGPDEYGVSPDPDGSLRVYAPGENVDDATAGRPMLGFAPPLQESHPTVKPTGPCDSRPLDNVEEPEVER